METGVVKSAARALDILDLLASHPEGLILTDLQVETGYPVSSLHELLATLAHRNYVFRDELSRRYKLATKALQLAAAAQASSDVVALADPAMERLRDHTCETTSLALLEGDSILFVHKRPADNRLQIINPAGTRLPSHATGSGKVMLAWLPDGQLDVLFPARSLPRLTSRTITSKASLRHELATVRKAGYAFDNEESAEGVWAVAGCIRNHAGEPIAAISIVAPVPRVQTKDTSNWHLLVKEAAAEISAQLGFLEGSIGRPVVRTKPRRRTSTKENGYGV